MSFLLNEDEISNSTTQQHDIKRETRNEHTIRIATQESEPEAILLQNKFLLENLQGGIVYSDYEPPFHLRYATDGMSHLTGYTVDELTNMLQMDLVHQDDQAHLADEVARQFANGDVFEVVYRLLRKDGTYCYVLDRAKVVEHADGKKYIHCLLTDVTELKEMEKLAKLNEEKYRFSMEQSGTVLIEYHIPTHTLTFSDNYKELFGALPPSGTAVEVIKSDWVDESSQEDLKNLFKTAITSSSTCSMELLIHTTPDTSLWCSLHLVPIIYQGHTDSVVGCLKNIQALKREMAYWKELSSKDSLTGVLNRAAMQQFVEDHICGDDDDTVSALMVLDIDDFKAINDEFGHGYGDELLIELCNAISKTIPQGSALGRLGGDEFLVFTTFDKHTADLPALLNKIIQNAGKSKIPTAISIGVAWHTSDCDTFKKLYRNADTALYNAKNTNKGGYIIH